jgi:thiamine biosynthesis lipoprotein
VSAEEPVDTGLALGEGAGGVDAHRFSHAAMATIFEVIAICDDQAYARQAAQAGFELVDRLERELSRFLANSDISRINALAAGQTTRVSPETMECLEIARRLYRLTGGVFDISIGSGLETLELVPDEFVVRAPEDGVRLDLGGIGKGYALDRLAELLDEWDIHKVLIHGGFSSVLAGEAPPGRDGWPLTLTVPRGLGTGARIRISARRMALSASGTRKGAHIQDPRSGRAVEARAAWATVPFAPGAGTAPGNEWADIARSPAAVAEGLSTAFMVLSVEKIAALCRRGPGVQAWVAREGAPGAGFLHFGTGADGAGEGRGSSS